VTRAPRLTLAAAAALALAACGGGRGASTANAPQPAASTAPATSVAPATVAAPAATAAVVTPPTTTAAVEPPPIVAATPIGGRIAVVPGQPPLGIHRRAIAPPATSAVARRLYAALDDAYAARARFLRDGKSCLGIRTIDCFFKLNSLGGRVAVAGGIVGEIARTSTENTPCGAATRAFANGEQLLRATVSTWIAASDPEDNDPPSEVREESEHAAASYNIALLGFRAACGERPVT
jgi:hypothetical protein